MKYKTHVKIGDKVKVITGDQKGSLGTILSILKKKSIVTMDGILPRIRYKTNPQDGQFKTIETPIFIHVSNLMLWDKKTNQQSRIGYKIIEGEKKRYFKKSKNILF